MPFNRFRTLLASLAAFAALLAGQPAFAQEDAAAEGLPMWVIRDEDSTIYITGTVHMLPAGVNWASDKLKNAIVESKQLWLELPMSSDPKLWLELPMSSDPKRFAADAAPILIRYALASGRTLSSQLTKDEMAALNGALAKAGMPSQMSVAVNVMKPWYAALIVSMSPLIGAGFDAEEGVDVNLAKMAEDDGDEIRGFETVEDQAKMLSSGSDEDQLEALRRTLKAASEGTEKAADQGEAAFTAWAHGDVGPVTQMFSTMDAEADMGGASMEALLKNRNLNWAGQIEEILKGSGVAFVAVGAGHIVGPDNLIEILAQRGVKAERY
jgi:uncharacterized protein YbaP (TraB family)